MGSSLTSKKSGLFLIFDHRTSTTRVVVTRCGVVICTSGWCAKNECICELFGVYGKVMLGVV